MHYRLLGPLQVTRGDEPATAIDIGPPKQRAVLAVLLLAQGRVVSVNRLIDAVWGADPPANATASLQAYISNLRRALRDGEPQMASPIVRQPPGYYLAVEGEHLDLSVFGTRCAEAAAARWEEALAAADAALSSWRSPLLDDLRGEPWVLPEAERAAQLRADCMDHRITALLALGRVQQALAGVSELRAADPLADRGCWLQMLTLYRAGRASEALAAYSRHARLLDSELGLRPGPEVGELQTAILRQAPELAAWPRSPEWTGAGEVATPQPAPIAAAAGPSGPPNGMLVGRDRELAALTAVLADTGDEVARWVVLSGPAGIGKTRLAEEAVSRAGECDTVWVGCPDESASPPWWPMRQLVRALSADADEVLEVPPHADPDTARFLVYERIQRLLESAQRALVVVIDDVQWADSTSASCLAYIAGAMRAAPVSMIITARDGEHPPEVARLLATVARGDRNRRIEVPALSPEHVAVLANQIATDPADEVSDEEALTLARRTGGNPFFVSEYARLPRVERANEIPVAVKSVLDRRLAGLDPAVLQVLRTAAVIGDSIDSEAVAVLASSTRLDIDTLADYLDEAADERIVVTSLTGDGYVFAHGLLRDHLLAGMSALRRQRLHAKVADALTGRGGEEALTRRAQHLVAAQPTVEPAVVVAACRLAAQQATERWSSDIAAGWWQAALHAYDRLPAAERIDSERDGLTVSMLEAHSRAGRGRLVLETVERYLVQALRAGRSATAGRVASALLRASGGWPWLAPGQDPGDLLALLERSTKIADADPSAQARVLAALAVGHCYHPDATVAAALLDRAQSLADATGDPDIVADVLMGRLITYSGVATFSRQTLAWVDQLNALGHSRSHEDSVIAHSVATMAAMNLGEVDRVQRHLEAGIAGSEELQLPVLRAQLRWTEAVLAVWRGDFAEAERHHRIAAHVHEQTELYEAGSGMLATATLLREKGDPGAFDWGAVAPVAAVGGADMVAVTRAMLLTTGADARAEAAEGLRVWRAGTGRAQTWTTLGHTVLLAHLAADHGLREFAPALVAELAPFDDRIAVIGQVGMAGPVALALARLHALRGERDEATRRLVEAEALAVRTGALPSALRCRLLACELTASDEDRRAAARALAIDAEQLGMHGLAEAARALC